MTKLAEYLSPNLSFTPAVVGFLITNDQVLLGLRKKVSLGLGQDLISGIGGKIGDSEYLKGETADQALIREIQEEIKVTPTGYQNHGSVRFIFPNKPSWNQIVDIYTISSWTGKPHETKAIRPLWFDKTQLPISQMWHDNRFWVPKILAGDRVNMIFLYNQNNNQVEEFQNV